MLLKNSLVIDLLLQLNTWKKRKKVLLIITDPPTQLAEFYMPEPPSAVPRNKMTKNL